MVCAKFRIRGRVQGVFFRASARQEALRRGITGYAKNLADGSVEVLACGDEAVLDALHGWLRRGPPHADVAAVERVMVEVDPPSRFETI